MSSACLDEATILAVGRGTVQGADRLPIEEHVAECDECRSLVSAVARGSMLDLVSVLGEGASPKPPSVTVPRADSQAISERVAREVPRSGIEHAAAPLVTGDDDDDDVETNRPPMSNPLAVSRVPDPPESLSTTPEIIPSPKPAAQPVAAVVAPASSGVPLWLVLLFVVLLAATAAMAAIRFLH